MKAKLAIWWNWAKTRPTVIVNIVGLLIIIIGGGVFIAYQLTRPIDVLKNWTIHTSDAPKYTTVNGKKTAVYNPGDSLVFTSQSTKLLDAHGTTSRIIVCKAVGKLKAREIQLDTLPANRPAGYNPQRENAIVVPDVAQFNGLPRTCRLIIDITYESVTLWRNYTEHAESDWFIVEEAKLDPAAIRKQIQQLNDRIDQLEDELSAAKTSPNNIATTPQSSGTTPVQNGTQPASNGTKVAQGGTKPADNGTETPSAEPTDDGFQLHDLPLVGGVLKELGL